MKPLDTAALLSLAALWGGSYLFIRMGAGEFGPVALAGLRAAGAALLLAPLFWQRTRREAVRTHWRALVVVGLAQNAVPYLLFNYAALSLTAGASAILTATTPLFGAVIAWRWFGERLTMSRAAGLAVGLLGVVALVAHQAGVKTEGAGVGAALAACLGAAFLYGWAANYTKRHLAGVAPLTVVAGSQAVSVLVLALPTMLLWPEVAPTGRAWAALAALSIACTTVAYALFFWLITRVGAARTVAVTFLIPAFGVLWGALFLGEPVTLGMLAGGAVILVGTALTTGVVRWGGWGTRRPVMPKAADGVSSELALPSDRSHHVRA